MFSLTLSVYWIWMAHRHYYRTNPKWNIQNEKSIINSEFSNFIFDILRVEMGSISCPFHWNISINLFTLVLALTTECKWIIFWIIYACVLFILWMTFGHLKWKISIHNFVRWVRRCSASFIFRTIIPSILLHFTTALK